MPGAVWLVGASGPMVFTGVYFSTSNVRPA